MSAQAKSDNVVDLKPKPEQPESTELELVERLLELIKARVAMSDRREEAAHELALVDAEVAKAEEEIVEIKRTLGASVRGRRRTSARPTTAATSQSGSPPTTQPSVAEKMLATMKRREWWLAGELIEAMGMEQATEPDKQRVRNQMLHQCRKGVLKRRAAPKSAAPSRFMFGLRSSHR